MFRSYASSICLFSIPVCPHRLSRAIHQHIFCRLASAQFADYITASPTHILFWFAQTITFSPVYLLYIFEFEHVCTCFIPMFHSFAIFPPQCATIDSAERSWIATQKGRPYYLDLQRATSVPIRLSAHIHVCSTLLHKIHTTQFRLHPPVTSTEVMKHLHTPTVALRL